MGATPIAAELVELADAEPVGVHDHHRRAGRDADLTPGSHQDIQLAGGKAAIVAFSAVVSLLCSPLIDVPSGPRTS